MVLILFALPLNSFAEQENTYGGIDMSNYSKSELDLSQFTLEDIMNMSAEEYGALVREFERVYDPYGTYVEGNETMHVEIKEQEMNEISKSKKGKSSVNA